MTQLQSQLQQPAFSFLVSSVGTWIIFKKWIKVGGEIDFRRKSWVWREQEGRQWAAPLSAETTVALLSPASLLREKTLPAKKPLCPRSGQAAGSNPEGVFRSNCSPVCYPGYGSGQLQAGCSELQRSQPVKLRARGCRKQPGGGKAKPPTPRATAHPRPPADPGGCEGIHKPFSPDVIILIRVIKPRLNCNREAEVWKKEKIMQMRLIG